MQEARFRGSAPTTLSALPRPLMAFDLIAAVPRADAGRVEVIAGISLPMLLRAITYRRDSLDVVVEMALAGAQSGAVRVDNRIRVGPQ